MISHVPISISKLIFLSLFLTLSACKMNNHPSNDDMNALNRIIRIDANFKSARWEVFTTPEYDGGVPGPTDYVSLVIEFDSSSIHVVANDSRFGSIWIAPGSARPWITKQNQLFFKNFENKTIDISSQKNCSGISAWLAKTNKKIDGIFCQKSSTGLMYFTLEDLTS